MLSSPRGAALSVVPSAPDGTYCGQSRAESLQFVCEPPHLWARRKAIYVAQAAKQEHLKSDEQSNLPRWWQHNYEPNFSCAYERRLGSIGDGGKWVCDPDSIEPAAAAAGRGCVVYSIGSGGMFGFEAAVHETLPGCVIHTFDHTVGNRQTGRARSLPDYIRFHPYGLAATDVPGTPMRSLGSIRRELGHDAATGAVSIELLKVDIEGAEFGALLPWLRAGDLDGVRQLLIEIHEPQRDDNYATTRRIFDELDAAGWVITHKEPNLLAGSRLVEYAFLKLDWDVKRKA